MLFHVPGHFRPGTLCLTLLENHFPDMGAAEPERKNEPKTKKNRSKNEG